MLNKSKLWVTFGMGMSLFTGKKEVKFLLFKISQNKTFSHKTKAAFAPGKYSATIIDIHQPEGFKKDTALDVEYCVDVNGTAVNKSERFFLNGSSERLQHFSDVLEQLGVKHLEEAIGKKLFLQFAFDVKNGKKFLNIVEYEALEEGGDK